MSYLSYGFFLLMAAGLILSGFARPEWKKWILLAMSLIFLGMTGEIVSIWIWMISTAAGFAAALLLERAFTGRRLVMVLTAALQLGLLAYFKYADLPSYTIEAFCEITGRTYEFEPVSRASVLGISFYTLMIMGYDLEVYRGERQAVRSFTDFCLFTGYFGHLVQGPVDSYAVTGTSLAKPGSVSFEEFQDGCLEILTGLFKKLIISERLAVMVNTIYGEYTSYRGFYLALAAGAFSLQLYTDFSGCMDIVLGLSQSLGIALPENFQTPFFAKSVAEYWRRWHITLGVWMKDYVFYPLLRSKLFTNLNQSLKKKFGKKRGKQYATFAAMFVLWLTVGIWHGGDWKFVIGSGLLHWFYIVMEELLAPPFARLNERLHLNGEGRFLGGVRILRTFFLVCIGDLFFRADSLGDAFAMLRESVRVWNPQILWDGSLLQLGLDGIETAVAVLSLLLLWAVSLRQRKESVRESVAKKPLPIRWVLWYALLFAVILLGYYGPGYSAAEFIYQGF